MAYIDGDSMKAFNNEHGKEVTDGILDSVLHQLQEVFNEDTDLCIREHATEGDEWIIIGPNDDHKKKLE